MTTRSLPELQRCSSILGLILSCEEWQNLSAQPKRICSPIQYCILNCSFIHFASVVVPCCHITNVTGNNHFLLGLFLVNLTASRCLPVCLSDGGQYSVQAIYCSPIFTSDISIDIAACMWLWHIPNWFIQSLPDSLTPWLTHSLTHPLLDSIAQTHSLFHSFLDSLTHGTTHSHTHSLIHSI